MGQSILRNRRKPFRRGVRSNHRHVWQRMCHGVVCDYIKHDRRTFRKGIGLIFPNLATRRQGGPFCACNSWRACACHVYCHFACTWVTLCGNANELRDGGQARGKSCLFFIRGQLPGISLARDRETVPEKHCISCNVHCSLVAP